MSPAPTSLTKTLTIASAFRSGTSWRSSVRGMAAMSGYLLAVVGANVALIHWSPITLAGSSIPVGALFAGASLTVRDLLHEVLGARGTVAGIAAGAGLSAVLASPQIAVASVVAFTVSEGLDALVYARLSRRSRLGAIAVSNAVGLVVDSALFVPLAFGSMAAAPGQLVGKTVVAVLLLAVLHVVLVARRVVER